MEADQVLLNQLVLHDSPSDSQLISTVVKVIENGKQEDFIKILDEFAAEKDGEIESICQSHYQEFIDSVEQLLRVRIEAKELREQVAALRENIKSVGREYYEEVKEIQKLHCRSLSLLKISEWMRI
jgi:ribosomal protein S8